MEFLSDISPVLFFAFATLSMLSISSIIAIEIAKVIRYKRLNNEYENLKEELHDHITRNVYTIDFSDEANLKYQEFKQLEHNILSIKGENHENK